MGWRIIQITKPCKLSIKDKQLLYLPQDGAEIRLPLEDISVLIFENKQISLSSYLLSELAEYDIVLFSCDGSHIPLGTFFPFHNHSRYSEIAWLQIETSEPLKKRIWQEIVKAKIKNQAEVLSALNKDGAQKLQEIAKTIQSGDAKNAEAFAAGLYWKNLWNNFNRHNETDIRNSALDYGYAIIRGAVARAIVGAGLLPCFGIHHANKLNSFNLADDLMEPFRPFLDYQVATMNWDDIAELSTDIKHKLVGVLTQTCLLEKDEIGLLYCCEIEASSLAKAIKNKSPTELKIPRLKKLPLFQ